MALSVTHSTASDGTFSGTGATAWDAAHTISGHPDIFAADAVNTDFDLTNGGAGGAVTILSKSVTGIAAKDQVILEIVYSILNNSAAARTYTPTADLGGLSLLTAETTTVAASATNRSLRMTKVVFSVSATNLTYGNYSAIACGASPTSGAALNSALSMQSWNSTTSNLTGTQTISFTVSSSSTTTTQTLTLHSYTIKKIASNP